MRGRTANGILTLIYVGGVGILAHSFYLLIPKLPVDVYIAGIICSLLPIRVVVVMVVLQVQLEVVALIVLVVFGALCLFLYDVSFVQEVVLGVALGVGVLAKVLQLVTQHLA